jgi:hypothetical protein
MMPSACTFSLPCTSLIISGLWLPDPAAAEPSDFFALDAPAAAEPSDFFSVDADDEPLADGELELLGALAPLLALPDAPALPLAEGVLLLPLADGVLLLPDALPLADGVLLLPLADGVLV